MENEIKFITEAKSLGLIASDEEQEPTYNLDLQVDYINIKQTDLWSFVKLARDHARSDSNGTHNEILNLYVSERDLGEKRVNCDRYQDTLLDTQNSYKSLGSILEETGADMKEVYRELKK